MAGFCGDARSMGIAGMGAGGEEGWAGLGGEGGLGFGRFSGLPGGQQWVTRVRLLVGMDSSVLASLSS